jgi:hypothetical protein
MREPQTDTPGLILRELGNTSRVAFLPADLDRRFARDNLPDHGNLLANLIRWVARDDIPLSIKGLGLIDCHMYRQSHRLILHIVNLTNAGTWRAPVDELIPIGLLQVHLALPQGVRARSIQFLVSDTKHRVRPNDGRVDFEIKSILDQEVAVLS